MKRLIFTTNIKATKDKVWEILWNDATYREWTSVFSEGSYAVSDWKEGSKVQFLSNDGDGMYSIIEKSSPGRYMSFKHLGVVKNGKEQPNDEETKKWSGSMENYTLNDVEGFTELIVEIDITEDHEDYFRNTFPKAVQKIKEISERKE
jgi:hypothetical protein